MLVCTWLADMVFYLLPIWLLALVIVHSNFMPEIVSKLQLSIICSGCAACALL